MKKFFLTLFIIILILALSFGLVCAFTWALCFVLGLFSITLLFSWKLVFAIWIIMIILQNIFSKNNNVKITY